MRFVLLLSLNVLLAGVAIAQSPDAVLRHAQDLLSNDRSRDQSEHSRRSTAAINDWQDCTMKFAQAVASSNAEPAETITKSAFAICIQRENEAVRELIANLGPKWERFVHDEIFPAIKTTVRERTVAAVLVGRSQLNRGK